MDESIEVSAGEDSRMLSFFRVCAYIELAMVMVFTVLNFMIGFKGPESVAHLPTVLLIPICVLVFAGAFSFFALWPAMMWHCMVVNKTTAGKKVLWMVLLLFTMFVGVLVYYFITIEAER
jgi:hypothetical protein